MLLFFKVSHNIFSYKGGAENAVMTLQDMKLAQKRQTCGPCTNQITLKWSFYDHPTPYNVRPIN